MGTSLSEDRSQVVIRSARGSDAEAVSRVLRSAFSPLEHLYTPEAFSLTVLDPDEILVRLTQGPIWVCEDRQEIVGSLAGLETAKGLYLRSMAVVPGRAGGGMGQQLLHTAEAFACEAALRRLCLCTAPFLTRAMQLYEGFGFTRVSDGPTDLFGTPLVNLAKELQC